MIAEKGDIREYVADATPALPRGWYGMCAGLTDRVVARFTGGDRQWFNSATDARRMSGALDPDASACPPGGIHFWSYVGTAWDGSRGDWGHTGPEIIGGGRGLLSATGYAYEPWALNAGLITVEAQSARPGMEYLGWAPTYGRARPLIISTESTAGGGTAPFNPGGFLMALNDAEQNEMLTLLRGMLSSQDQVTLFQNVQAVRDRAEGNLSSQHQVEVYQTGNTIRDRVDAILTILGKTPPSGAPFDVEGVAAALREGLGEDLVAALAKQLTK